MFSQKPALTLRNESNEPFSMYSTTIITGLPENTHTSCNYTLSTSLLLQHLIYHIRRNQSRFHINIHSKPRCILLFLNTGSPHHCRLAGLQLRRPICNWSVKPFSSPEGEHIGVTALKEGRLSSSHFEFTPFLPRLSHTEWENSLTGGNTEGVEYFLFYGTTSKSVQMNGIFNISNL